MVEVPAAGEVRAEEAGAVDGGGEARLLAQTHHLRGDGVVRSEAATVRGVTRGAEDVVDRVLAEGTCATVTQVLALDSTAEVRGEEAQLEAHGERDEAGSELGVLGERRKPLPRQSASAGQRPELGGHHLVHH